MNTRNRVLAVAILCAVAAGCGSSATTSSAIASGSSTGSSSPVASTAPTGTPTASPTPSPIALPQGSEPVTLDPAQFAGVAIDNPFWPMAKGSTWIYRETDADGAELRVEVTVTNETKEILGITATVVHDVLTEDGEVVEDTFDWYAQDATGNLWYLGEDTKEFEAGKVVSTEGSWEAGVDGAQPGILLPAAPEVGMAYRQEYYAGHAEDSAEILSLNEHADVAAGSYDGLLQTKEVTALEPDVVEQKFYARGVGEVQAVQVSGGTSREELISFTPG